MDVVGNHSKKGRFMLLLKKSRKILKESASWWVLRGSPKNIALFHMRKRPKITQNLRTN